MYLYNQASLTSTFLGVSGIEAIFQSSSWGGMKRTILKQKWSDFNLIHAKSSQINLNYQVFLIFEKNSVFWFKNLKRVFSKFYAEGVYQK